jgi:hypothetical protein
MDVSEVLTACTIRTTAMCGAISQETFIFILAAVSNDNL